MTAYARIALFTGRAWARLDPRRWPI